MGGLRALDRLVRILCTGLGILGAISIVFIQFLTTADVILRDTITRPIVGSFELVEYAMVVTVFSAYGFTQMNRFHISVDVVVGRLPARWRGLLDSVTLLLMLLFFATAIWIGYDQTMAMVRRGAYSQVLLIARWPFQAMVVVGFVSFCLAILRDFLFAAARALGRDVEPTLKHEDLNVA